MFDKFKEWFENRHDYTATTILKLGKSVLAEKYSVTFALTSLKNFF
jgi:hypothetical protein